MDIFIYIMIFILGTVFGSFFTLAVYRIPLRKDITHERSFCPNCNHRLEFLDLIPVLSYIFLGGKCRYCGQKIRIRYLLLEILSGIVFFVAYLSLNLHFPDYPIDRLVYFASFIFMYITLVLVAGIDKEHHYIHKGVIAFGIIMQTAYELYMYTMKGMDIFNFSIYLVSIILLIIFDTIILKKKNKSSYLIELLILFMYLNLCIGIHMFLIVIMLSAFLCIIFKMIDHIRFNINSKSDILSENVKNIVPIGFVISITTIAVVLVENFLNFF